MEDSTYRQQKEKKIIEYLKKLEGSVDQHTAELTLLNELLHQEITERQEAIKALKRSEARYRELAESISDVFFAMDQDLKFTYWNAASEKVTGIRASEALGKSLYEIFPNIQGTEAQQKYMLALKTGEPQYFVDQYKWGGKNIFYEIYAYPSSHGLAVVAKDITPRRRAEEQLLRQKTLLQAIKEVFHQALICETEAEFCRTCLTLVEDLTGSQFGWIGEVNQANRLDTLSISHTGWQACNILDLSAWGSGKDREICGIWGRVLKDEKSLIINDPAAHPDRVGVPAGHVPLHSFLGVPLKHKDRTIGLICVANKPSGYDQADQEAVESLSVAIVEALMHKRAALALRESEDQFRNLLEFIPGVSIQGYTCDGTVVYWNKASEEIYGYTAAEALGRNLGDLIIPPDLQPEFKKGLELGARAKKSGELMPGGEYLLLHKDGSSVPVYSIHTVVCRADRAPTMFCIDIDLTERKKREAERFLISKLESLGILAGGIAHDFNNILTAILGNLNLASLDPKLRKKSREKIQKAESACMQAQGLARQLLTFAKGGVPVTRPTAIARLITDSTKFALSGAKSRAELSLPPDLWPVKVDEGQITQVISNLIINADQAMPEGGIIKVHAENITVTEVDRIPLTPGRYVKITIADQGIGIPERYLDKIFDPYFTTKQQGSGLGLAIAHSIVSNHGGYITVESNIGEGSKFHLYLPAHQTKIAVQKKVAPTPPKGQGYILIMDDKDIVREVLGKMLRKMGYKVKYARDGTEAREIYQKTKIAGQPFTAVILDLTVPGGVGGKEVLKQIRQIDPQVKAIVSSGYNDDPVMSDYSRYGFQGVLAKPYKIEDLSKVLREIINEEA
ncbi:MAG: PAS domain S-box protein [Deltaproteobacteria bacterium]|nr:PAS domain S-box protein [Deltaproteobacteria bacterium]